MIDTVLDDITNADCRSAPTGRTSPLTRDDEVRLAKHIEAGLYADHLLRTHDAEPNPAREADLEVIAERGRQAKQHLTRANLGLVVGVARRYTGRGMSLADLVQEGTIGLIHAIDKHDYTLGYKFSTYAVWWIRQAVTRALAEYSRMIRVPARVLGQINQVVRTRRVQTRELGRQPSIEETAEVLGMSPSKVVELLSYNTEPVSLDQVIGTDGTGTLADLLPYSTVAPASTDTASYRVLRQEIDTLLSSLTRRERDVISLRCGLHDDRERTLDEVGKELGVSRERIRQIEKRTLSKLRETGRTQHLRAFVS